MILTHHHLLLTTSRSQLSFVTLLSMYFDKDYEEPEDIMIEQICILGKQNENDMKSKGKKLDSFVTQEHY